MLLNVIPQTQIRDEVPRVFSGFLYLKKKIPVYAKNKKKMWDENSENLVKSWGQAAQFYRLLNEQTAYVYHRRDRWFGIPVIVLGTVTTSTMFIQMDTCDNVKSIISGVLSLCCTLLTALGKFFSYHEMENLHNKNAQLYDSVVLDIQEQMCLPRSHREDAITFMHGIKRRMRELKQVSTIPQSVFKQYIQNVDHHFQNLGIDINANDYSAHELQAVYDDYPNANDYSAHELQAVYDDYPNAIQSHLQPASKQQSATVVVKPPAIDDPYHAVLEERLHAYTSFFA